VTCLHCHHEIPPGTERTFWDSVKHHAWVCATCAAFLISAVPAGQLSPQHVPLPILRAARRVEVDSGSSGSTLSVRYRQQLNDFFVAGQDSDAKPMASLTVPHEGPVPTLPRDEQPNPDNQPHPPHQGSTFLGVSGSGAMANTNATITVTSWEPPDPGYSPLARLFASQSSSSVMLRVGSVTPRHRPLLPLARRNC